MRILLGGGKFMEAVSVDDGMRKCTVLFIFSLPLNRPPDSIKCCRLDSIRSQPCDNLKHVQRTGTSIASWAHKKKSSINYKHPLFIFIYYPNGTEMRD